MYIKCGYLGTDRTQQDQYRIQVFVIWKHEYTILDSKSVTCAHSFSFDPLTP